jgi:ribosome-associated protein
MPIARKTKAGQPEARKAKAPAASKKLLGLIEKSLDDDKAENVVAIDLSGKSSIADYMVIASGRSARQLGAMADHLTVKLKALGIGHVGVEGKAGGDWILLDGGDVIVHLFRPEIRQTYNLEKMWGMELPDPELALAVG